MYELQFHPANIRRPVRYLFLSRRTARWVMVGTGGVALLVLLGIILAPIGVRSVLLEAELRSATQQNQLQRQVLSQRDERLHELQSSAESARARQAQISLILGAPEPSVGLGGYPEVLPQEARVPEALLALRRAGRLETETKALLTLADELIGFARENRELTRIVPAVCPLPAGSFVLTSPFGERTSPFTGSRDFHAGIDLAARTGTPVLAAGDARVVFAGRFPLKRNVRWWRYGNVVALAHGDRYMTIYAHLDRVDVRTNQKVERGQQVGTVGNTGWSTSPHLHYEVRRSDDAAADPVPADPRIYILDYQWTGQERLLAASRRAPPQDFDPLPSLLR